jgi:hypothetical protein
MSKTNDTSSPAALEDYRPLADSELDAVTGGYVPTSVDVGNLKTAVLKQAMGPDGITKRS